MKQVWRTLPSEITSHLLQRCRMEQTTMSGALAAAACHAMAEVLDASSSLRCRVQVNIRPDCQRHRRTLGCYVGSFRVALDPGMPLWELARAHRADLTCCRRERRHLILALMQPYPFHLQLSCGEKSHPHPGDHPGIGNDLGISNRGAFCLATKSHCVTAVHWVREHRGDADSDFLLINACSVNGVLCLTLCYKDPIVDQGLIAAITDKLMHKLVSAAGVDGAAAL